MYDQQINKPLLPVNQDESRYVNPVLMGLGEMTDNEALAVVKDHFAKLPASTLTQIGIETAQGKYDTLANEVRLCAQEICQAGVLDKAKDFMSQYGKGVLWAAGISVAAYAIYRFTKKGRK